MLLLRMSKRKRRKRTQRTRVQSGSTCPRPRSPPSFAPSCRPCSCGRTSIPSIMSAESSRNFQSSSKWAPWSSPSATGRPSGSRDASAPSRLSMSCCATRPCANTPSASSASFRTPAKRVHVSGRSSGGEKRLRGGQGPALRGGRTSCIVTRAADERVRGQERPVREQPSDRGRGQIRVSLWHRD
eukprot:Amastigsp_a339868_139.p4 type:complete len:185 gc:universal Amastigsp_a339868_139:381-935(+)